MSRMRNCRSDLKCCIFFFITVFALVSSSILKQYRTDYVYNRKTDAFYKFHIEPLSVGRSKLVCNYEGATLMVARSHEDIYQAHGMFKQYPDIGDLAWVGNDGNEHTSAEETPIIDLDDDRIMNRPNERWIYISNECDVITRTGDVKRYSCYRSLPFVCKIEAKDVIEDTRCKVYSEGYKYFEKVGNCYKIPKNAYSWNEAYAECRAHGANLLVLNSELEHQVIYNLTNEERIPITNAQVSHFFHVGIRAEKTTDGSPIVFKTIFDQTLEEAGYSQWTENEPNNALGNEYCGTVFKNDGKYNDISCSDLYGFICETNIHNTK